MPETSLGLLVWIWIHHLLWGCPLVEEGNNPAGMSDVKGCSELPHRIREEWWARWDKCTSFHCTRIVCWPSRIYCCLCKPLLSVSPGLGVNIAPALAPASGFSVPAPPAPPSCWPGIGWLVHWGLFLRHALSKSADLQIHASWGLLFPNFSLLIVSPGAGWLMFMALATGFFWGFVL